MIGRYQVLVFDCDGVILNSNKIKTEAFYRAALPYGEEAARALTEYHIDNGGISRYKKFAYFLDTIVPQAVTKTPYSNLPDLLSTYSAIVRQELLTCEVTPGLHAFRNQNTHMRWLIVSGSDQEELKDVFAERGLSELFDGGIFGSPNTKDEILTREIRNNNICQPALFIGDSKYDYQAAMTAGLDRDDGLGSVV